MLRLSRICLGAPGSGGQCLYKVLGVAPNASTEEIKGAFRQRAKATHPDTAAAGAARRSAADASYNDGFRDMVEAYRVLRDPRKRAEYDRQRGGRARGPSQHQHQQGGGHDEMGNQWPRGDGLGMSEEFRANLYGYDAPGRSGQQEAQAQMAPAGLKSEYAAVGLVFITGFWFLAGGKSALSGHSEPDPYPSRRPVRQHGQSVNLMASSSSRESSSSSSSSSTKASDAAAEISEAVRIASEQDELVRAYWNPFAEKWQRIPDGYEAPAAMDLTAWHKKRADPAEWSRLFAEGTLSHIIPRGGLRERFRPAWDTYEATLITDPLTGKTVQMSDNLPARGPKAVCDVQF